MNKYIVPYCNTSKLKVSNHIVYANSLSECKEKIMQLYDDYSEDWESFIRSIKNEGILIGRITDIEEL